MTTNELEMPPPYSLRDVSVLIPVRIDSPDRLRNLDIVLFWLASSFEDAEVVVLEHDVEARAAEVARRHGAEHAFTCSDGCFYKSHVFNLGLRRSDRPFVLLYDCDVLVSRDAVDEAVALLHRGEADYVYPYNGVMLEIRCADRDPRDVLDHEMLRGAEVCTGESLDTLPRGAVHLNGTLAEPSTGGALLCNRRTALCHGGFNPNIVSYGCEDTELETRVRKLGARVARLSRYNCLHIHHRRGPDSRYNEHHAANLAEWRKVEAMSAAEVAEYVQNGFRSDAPAQRADPAHSPARPSLADTAILLMLDAAPPLPGALVTALIDEIETTYSGYEIHLVERDGYRYRMVSHRDHVVYDAIRDESDHELLRRLTAEVERPHLCVGSVFVDAEKDALGVSIDALRDTSTRACELTTRSAKEKDGSRAARVTGVLRARLGSRARAFAIHRSSLVAWLARAAHFAPETRWDEILAMAVDDLARRPS